MCLDKMHRFYCYILLQDRNKVVLLPISRLTTLYLLSNSLTVYLIRGRNLLIQFA